MDTWILKLLRSDAQSWWYHMKLRDDARNSADAEYAAECLADARARERASIRSKARALRKALNNGGGWSDNGDTTTSVTEDPSWRRYRTAGGYRTGDGFITVAKRVLPEISRDGKLI